MNKHSAERRKYSRIPVGFSVVNFESESPDISVRYSGTIRDISEGGMGIVCKSIPKEYSTILLDFNFPGTSYNFNEMKGIVRWVQGDNFGIEFLDLTTEDREKIKEYLSEDK